MDFVFSVLLLAVFGVFIALSRKPTVQSKVFGALAGFTLIVFYIGVVTTGLEFPYGTTETVSGNVTNITQNFINIFDREDLAQQSFMIILIASGLIILVFNFLDVPKVKA